MINGKYSFQKLISLVLLSILCSACASKRPDYSLFEANRPTSILVVPPLNSTATVEAPDKFLATITLPVAERGYYVFPIAIVDRMLKENGVVSPIEMRQVSPQKLREIFGADALLDISIEEWGTSYMVLASTTTVTVNYRLIDLRSGQELWSRKESISDSSNSGGGGGLVGALVGAIVHAASNTASDSEIRLSTDLNYKILMNNKVGLLEGPRRVDDKD